MTHPPNFRNAYDNHTSFKIEGIEYKEGIEETPDPIEPNWSSPAISVDVAARFATHEIVGGSTVRQKIGEEPMEVEIEGVVKESVAKELDKLRNAESGSILSDRFPDGGLTVHFASISISPLEESGAAAIDDDEFLYSFMLSAVEVTV